MRGLRRQKGKGREIAGVQMAPMIDMVFLLLVFFMCVSSISQAGLRVEVELPEAERSEVADDFSNRVVVSIDAKDRVFVNSRFVEGDGLLRALRELADGASGLKLNIRADRSVHYSQVKAVMEAAAGVGISEIVYATHQK